MDYEPGLEDNCHEGHKHNSAPSRIQEHDDATPATAKKSKTSGGFPLRTSKSKYEPYCVDDSSVPDIISSNDDEDSAHFTLEESATTTDDSVSGRH
eukprot:3621342-Rhodomonas_salina.1